MPKFRSRKRKSRKSNGNQFAIKTKRAKSEDVSVEESTENSEESESEQTDHEGPAEHEEP